MDCHVTVSAEFPDVDQSQLSAIYSGLARKGWEKIMTMGRDVTTIWYKKFEDLTPARAITKTNLAFSMSTGGLCKPRYVIQVGNDRPTRGS